MHRHYFLIINYTCKFNQESLNSDELFLKPIKEVGALLIANLFLLWNFWLKLTINESSYPCAHFFRFVFFNHNFSFIEAWFSKTLKWVIYYQNLDKLYYFLSFSYDASWMQPLTSKYSICFYTIPTPTYKFQNFQEIRKNKF